MSGLPLWKLKEQMAKQKIPVGQLLQIDPDEKGPPKSPNVRVDGVPLGGDGKQKPVVRHVLVKDLHKVARALKLELPTTGIFASKAPVGLYAIFDGQSSASSPGPSAAEYCARNFHLKLLNSLSALPPHQSNETFVKAVLLKSFEDLDEELLRTQVEINDGCGAVVVLLIGRFLFSAQLGKCSVFLCESASTGLRPLVLGVGQHITSPDEQQRLRRAGILIKGHGSEARLLLPGIGESPVSRSLGDRPWKGPSGGVVCIPSVQCQELKGPRVHPYALLCASSISDVLTPQELLEVASNFHEQPRAASGEIATRALEKVGEDAGKQCTAVQICFLPDEEKDDKKKESSEPPLKKAKTNAQTQSMRLRHILVKFVDGQTPAKQPPPAKGKQVTRTRQEAESVLRAAILELRKDFQELKQQPKNATEMVQVTSKKFMELARKLSQCDSAQLGGATCGDLGWLSPTQRNTMGTGFKEATDGLLPGCWSDIALSTQGLHLVQRIA